jgi:hypothetical protein
MRQRASHRHQRPLGFGFLQRQSEVVQCHPCTWAKDWEERKWEPNKRWDCQPEFGWIWYIYILYMYIDIICYVCIYIYWPHILYYINKLHDHLNKHTNELQGGSIAAWTNTKSSSNKACVETHEYMLHTLIMVCINNILTMNNGYYTIILLVGGFNHLETYESMSQWEGLSHILWKIKNVWNHQPD